MRMSKRHFLAVSGASAGAALIGGCKPAPVVEAKIEEKPRLQSIVGDVAPISVEERLSRIEKAQRLMVANDIDAIFLQPCSAILYFSGVSWLRSERLTTVFIPR